MLFAEGSQLRARQNCVHATALFIIHINLWKRQRPGSFYNFVWSKSFTRVLLPFFKKKKLKFWSCHGMKSQDLWEGGEREVLESGVCVGVGGMFGAASLRQNKA